MFIIEINKIIILHKHTLFIDSKNALNLISFKNVVLKLKNKTEQKYKLSI